MQIQKTQNKQSFGSTKVIINPDLEYFVPSTYKVLDEVKKNIKQYGKGENVLKIDFAYIPLGPIEISAERAPKTFIQKLGKMLGMGRSIQPPLPREASYEDFYAAGKRAIDEVDKLPKLNKGA